MTKQIDIKELIPLFSKGWVSMDKNKKWWFSQHKPRINNMGEHWWSESGYQTPISDCFNIAPAEDWTKSLMKVGV